MITNIVNKAAEVRWWVERHHHGVPPEFEVVWSFVRQRWPDLDDSIVTRITRLVVLPKEETQ